MMFFYISLKVRCGSYISDCPKIVQVCTLGEVCGVVTPSVLIPIVVGSHLRQCHFS